jgi:DNA-directed RNA polymerase specialized sigma24 family protein
MSSTLSLLAPAPDVYERLRKEVLKQLNHHVEKDWGIYELGEHTYAGWLVMEACNWGMDCPDWSDYQNFPESWFIQRAVSRARDWFKREMRRREKEDEYARLGDQALTDEVFGDEDGRSRGNEVARLVKALEGPQRQVIDARFYGGSSGKNLPWGEVAFLLGMNERRAKYLCSQALGELRFWLGA